MDDVDASAVEPNRLVLIGESSLSFDVEAEAPDCQVPPRLKSPNTGRRWVGADENLPIRSAPSHRSS
jgi:hypothetical protein